MEAIRNIALALLCLSINTNISANFNNPINFEGPLMKSCPFVSDENVLATIDSLTLTLGEIRDNRASCQSLYTNSKAYLDTILMEMKSRDTLSKTNKINKESLLAEIYKRIQAGTYNEEFAEELLLLERQEQLYEDDDTAKDASLLNALSLGETLLNDLKTNPECDDNLGNLLLRPSLMLLGQIGNAVYPGSSLVSSGVVTAMSGLMDSFISYTQTKLGSVETTLDDLISSKNYYMSYKCAYKNINIMTCDMRNSEVSIDELKKLYKKVVALDTEKKDFKTLADHKKHYSRVQTILNQIKQIYETAQQQETIVEIASIQKETTKLSLLRPNPFGKMDWTDADENIKTWKNWNMSLGWTQYLNGYIKTYCKIYSQKNPNVWDMSNGNCEPSNILENNQRTEYIVEVVAPALQQLADNLTRLSEKLRESVNVERLFYAIRSEEDYADRIKEYRLSEVLQNFENDLVKEMRPDATKLFAERIKKTTKALKALIEFKGPKENKRLIFMDTSLCDISLPNYKCPDFKSLSQSVYTYLATNLSGGDVLSVEMIDATFYNYISGVEDYFLNGTSTEISENYSRYTNLANLYNSIKDDLLQTDGSGTSDVPLMNKARQGFQKVFGYEIVKKLSHDVENALKQGSGSDYFRDAVHSCAIYYPMLKNEKDLVKGVFKRKKIKRVRKKCDELLAKSNGIPLLISATEKFPLSSNGIDYQNQCYYRNYEREVLTRQTSLARDLQDLGDLPDL